jgi:threonine synthase
MDSMMLANRNGHIVCTQGGESLAGLARALKEGLVTQGAVGVLAATAHALKFSSFQKMYLTDAFPPEFEVEPRKEYRNTPITVEPEGLTKLPKPDEPLQGEEFNEFIKACAAHIAKLLDLKKR